MEIFSEQIPKLLVNRILFDVFIWEITDAILYNLFIIIIIVLQLIILFLRNTVSLDCEALHLSRLIFNKDFIAIIIIMYKFEYFWKW